MGNHYQQILTSFYRKEKIHPTNFNCEHRAFCQGFSFQGKMTEAKMSMVGSQYGLKYPRIVVISLDPPEEKNATFKLPEQRTTEFIAQYHETENFYLKRPGAHWAATQIIVNEILVIWGYQPSKGYSVVCESYNGRLIENVSPYFAHVNVAKCSMNNPGRGQSNSITHLLCSKKYLLEEISLLEPDILISQGKDTNQILGHLLYRKPIYEIELPSAFNINLNNRSILFLPMHHPSRQIAKIRAEWEFYLKQIKAWRDELGNFVYDMVD